MLALSRGSAPPERQLSRSTRAQSSAGSPTRSRRLTPSPSRPTLREPGRRIVWQPARRARLRRQNRAERCGVLLSRDHLGSSCSDDTLPPQGSDCPARQIAFLDRKHSERTECPVMRFRKKGGVEPLPTFRYHPDPVSTGSVRVSGAVCLACGRSRGYIYVGPVYAVDEFDSALCPWCIADGSAARIFDAAFTDVGSGVPAGVAPTVLDEVEHRTPGFQGWQQEHWLYHCDDAAAFVGRAGHAELLRAPGALDDLLARQGPSSALEVEALDADGDRTAYLFRCVVCGAHLAYADSA